MRYLIMFEKHLQRKHLQFIHRQRLKAQLAVKKKCSDDQNKFVLIKMRRTNATEQIFEQYFLNKLKDSKCITRILSMGEQTIKEQLYHYQVMERHGPSLKLVYNFLSKNIPITILCLIAIQTLVSLEQIHKQLIIHRNIRPKKLLISQNGSEILLTDFKFACRYRKQQKNIIVNDNLRNSSNKRFLNKFSSLNQHLDQVSSPKDDLESLALIIIYYGGFASVLDIQDENKGLKIKKLEHVKLSLLPELSFKGAPLEFIQFYNGIKQSCVSDYPQDYEKYKQIFRKLLNTCGYSEKDIVYPHLQMMKQYHYNNVNVIMEEQETQAQIDSIDEDQSVFRKIKELDGKRYHRLISLENQKQCIQKE
ncbi:unnamed protein product [Paramecium sonneborni]|uniref:Casein kinase I n=1 Tax=Paramecium sonneborni TaxID=65129 RepID=A0A8S1P5U0_9CILI|nr:unnamed protein product [Paramecium sonneborni]